MLCRPNHQMLISLDFMFYDPYMSELKLQLIFNIYSQVAGLLQGTDTQGNRQTISVSPINVTAGLWE